MTKISALTLLLMGFAITIIGVIIFISLGEHILLTQIMMVLGTLCTDTAMVRLIVHFLSTNKLFGK